MANHYGALIIGAGTMGRNHTQAWQAHPQVEVKAIADIVPGLAAKAADEFGVAEAVEDYAPLLRRDDIHVVSVCTPPFAHCKPTVDSVGAGKHVICEKPFALTVAEAQQMAAAAEAADRYLVMASGRSRYGAASLKAKALIEAGELGNLYHARSSQFRQRGRPGVDILKQSTWFLSKQRAGGGALIDIGVYEIDVMLWLLGNPAVLSVSATTYQGIGAPREDVAQEVEDHVALFCQLEGSRSFSLEIAWSSHLTGHNTRFVLGDQGGLKFDPLTLMLPPPEGERNCEERQVLEGPDRRRGEAPPALQAAMIDALEGGPPPMTPARDAVVVTQVITAGYESAATGKPVVLGG